MTATTSPDATPDDALPPATRQASPRATPQAPPPADLTPPGLAPADLAPADLAPADERATAAAPLRVLVIDDDAVDRMAVRRGLSRAGVASAVDEAASEREALALLDARIYDCIFLDYNIPGGDGFALLRAVRSAGGGAPVVMLTGQRDEQVAVDLMKAGAVDYLPKAAVTPERLASSLRYAVELSRADTERRRAQDELRASADRARFLAAATAVLVSTLDVKVTLDRVAALAVPVVGDYCLIYLVDADGAAGAVAAAHADPALRGLMRDIERRFRPRPEHPTSGVAEVIRTGRSKLIERITPEYLAGISTCPEDEAAYATLAPATALYVPLAARTVLGAAVFCRSSSRPGFSPDDVAFAEDLAHRAATALENARLYEEAQRARTRVERLQQVTARLAAVLPGDEVARIFVAQVREALDADTAWLALISPDGSELVSVADVGFKSEAIARFSRVPVAASLPTRDILIDAQARWFSSKAELFAAYPALADSMRDMDQEAVALLPITLGAGVFGIMTLGFHERRAFPPEDRGLAIALAQQCAQAVERARLYQAERESRAAAEEANRAKSEFLARMSHDLRTPLNAIGGYAQLIEEGIYGPTSAGQRQSLERIRRAQQHLLILINDILSFARLEAGQVRLDVQDLVVRDVLAELRPLIEPQVAERRLGFELQLAPPELHVRADRDRLTQILVNLLTNAVKFTEPGGSIAVTTEGTGETVTIRVRDTGRGIPTDRLAAIFDPFVQAGESIAERQGVGLGLAISRELARMMQGELTVESTVGVGSTFTLRLPKGGE